MALLGIIVSLGSYGVGGGRFGSEPPTRWIGATAVVTEIHSGLPLAARVDTGATTSSIHYETIEIENAARTPTENIGKPIRFLIKNKAGADAWIESKVVDYMMVRTSNYDDWRYAVRLRLRWEDVEKEVLVTLNDRARMTFPVLLGRNFLSDDFVVNVGLDHQGESDVPVEPRVGTAIHFQTDSAVPKRQTLAVSSTTRFSD